jgi:hypothetical protein
MSRRIKLIGALVALAAVAVTVPLALASRTNDNRLVIGVRVDFDSSTHATGTFAACCAVNDDGTAEAQVLSFDPNKAGTEATFRATNTFNGQKGSFTIQLRGVTGPLDSPRHIAHASFRVIDGTGAYARLDGDGQLTAVTDETNGSLTGVAEGEGHGASG